MKDPGWSQCKNCLIKLKGKLCPYCNTPKVKTEQTKLEDLK